MAALELLVGLAPEGRAPRAGGGQCAGPCGMGDPVGRSARPSARHPPRRLAEADRAALEAAERGAGPTRERARSLGQVLLARRLPDYWQRFEAARLAFVEARLGDASSETRAGCGACSAARPRGRSGSLSAVAARSSRQRPEVGAGLQGPLPFLVVRQQPQAHRGQPGLGFLDARPRLGVQRADGRVRVGAARCDRAIRPAPSGAGDPGPYQRAVDRVSCGHLLQRAVLPLNT